MRIAVGVREGVCVGGQRGLAESGTVGQVKAGGVLY